MGVMSRIKIHTNNLNSLERLTENAFLQTKFKNENANLTKNLTSAFDSVMKSENELYFQLRDILFPRISCLSKINNYLYREEIGLELTDDIVESEKELLKIDSIQSAFRYNTDKYEFLVARTRHLISHTLSLDAGDSTLNASVRLEIINRFVE